MPYPDRKTSPDDLLTIPEVARLGGFGSRAGVYVAINGREGDDPSDLLPARKVRGKLRVRRADLAAWLARNSEPHAPQPWKSPKLQHQSAKAVN